jgi:hypothetical protein
VVVVLGHPLAAAGRGEDAFDEAGRQRADDLGVVGRDDRARAPEIRTTSPLTFAWKPSRSSARGISVATSWRPGRPTR